MTKLSITKGAAFLAISLLSKGLSSIDDIFSGGSLAVKLKPAKKPPKQEENESGRDYQDRVEAWTEEPFGDLEIEDHEKKALELAIKTLADKKELPSNEFTCELIAQLGMQRAKAP